MTVPPQFASWGAPPPSWYIDDLMRHEGAAYYTGLLSAAEIHGASHQAVMEFQVITAKRLSKIRAGRSLIVFYFRKDAEKVKMGIEEHKTDTGVMKVSSAALTALDMLRYPRASGGIDNIAVVLSELGWKIDAKQLAEISAYVEMPIVQRLGYLLDNLDAGHGVAADKMFKALRDRGVPPWTEFDRGEIRSSDFRSEPKKRDSRWRVVVRRIPELDE
ncbi:MAG: type IV toxin-antitoxin system AbiEi family antitoxin domain-containing protein [Rhodospirillales bacterium]